MPSHYENISSAFIKAQLEKTPWANHQYIDDLIILARFVTQPPQSWAAGMQRNQLMGKYPEEYRQLVQELDPQRAERWSENNAVFVQGTIAQETAQQIKDAEVRESWLRAGGQE